MRKFWIRNARGETFDMNREDAFFSNPKGLGIARKSSYERLGDIWTVKENYMSQKKPQGDMIFDGYEQYDEFLRIVQYTPLTLLYQPLDTMYYMDVDSFTIEKGEISYKDTFLTCKVVFNGTSPWYLENVFTRREAAEGGKQYTYKYPYTYVDDAIGEATLQNNSGMEAYCRLVIYGPVKNPSWKVTKGEETIVEGRVLEEIGKDSCLVVNSDPDRLEIAQYDWLGGYEQDLYEKSDFDTERFLYLPPGEARIKVDHAGPAAIKFYTEVREFAG